MKLTTLTKAQMTNVQPRLRELLSEGKVTVTFTKQDGSARVMECTTNPVLAPEVAKVIPKSSPEVMTVWDLKANDWRSFRWDSLNEVKFETV
jgi:hypothetical protein